MQADIEQSSETGAHILQRLLTVWIILLTLMLIAAPPLMAQSTVIYVNPDNTTGPWDGTAWATGWQTIQEAVDAASVVDEIWLKQGTYPLAETVSVTRAVALYGGFAGTETARNQRDWKHNLTVVDGQNVVFHCFYISADATLDGLVITGGAANGDNYPDNAGGGIYTVASPTIANCSLSYNTAIWGGGINTEDQFPTIINSTFSGNTASIHGGAIYNQFSDPLIINSTFSGNSAATYGGAIANSDAGATITNCTFFSNSAGSGGGGIFNDTRSSDTVITNTILWMNAAPSGPQIHEFSGSEATTTYCNIQGGYPGLGNIDADPLFFDPVNEDFHIRAGSAAVDSGSNGTAQLPVFDFEGETRVVDGNFDQAAIVDMGADEYVDADFDGMPDWWEISNGLDETDASNWGLDPDGDGLDNLGEYQNSTDPNNPDSDGDGYQDGREINGFGDPLNSGVYPLIERVSMASDGTPGNGPSNDASISTDGSLVAFTSGASNLVPEDTNGYEDVFVHDRQTGSIERVSVASDGTQGNHFSSYAAISSDGRFVAFRSYASNLVPDDTNNQGDVFVHDRQTGATERVSVASDGTQGNGTSTPAAISSDGRFIAFTSTATNLVADDVNGLNDDVFVHDRQTGTTELIGVNSDGVQGSGPSVAASISSNGRFVAFQTANNLVPGDTNGATDAFVRDRVNGTTERVSVASDGAQGNALSYPTSISSDGRLVVIVSHATNLVTGDTNGREDIFVHDRHTGTTERVSVASDGTQGNDGSISASISSDGRYVAFSSGASNLVSGDTNLEFDIFVHDRQSRTTLRASVIADGSEADDNSHAPSISADGRSVAFESVATNLVSDDTNAASDIFVTDLTDPPPISIIEVGVDGCNTNVAINNAIGQSFKVSLSTDLDHIKIWIKPELYYQTSYHVELHLGEGPAGPLLGTSSTVTMESQTDGVQAGWYGFDFSGQGLTLLPNQAYTLVLVRLSTYSGAFARCADIYPDGIEYWLGFSPDPMYDIGFGVYGAEIPDADSDGIPDSWELENGVDDPDADPDNDGMSNLFEYQNNSDPNLYDADSPVSSIGGTVYQEDGTTPVIGSAIEVQVISGDPCGGYTIIAGAQTDPTNGSFIISDLVPGIYYLKTADIGTNFIDEWFAGLNSVVSCGNAWTLTLNAATLETADFQLSQGAVISGRITSSTAGLPLAGVRVDLHNDTLDQYFGSITTDGSGFYEYNGLQAGCYQIQAFPPPDIDGTAYIISGRQEFYLAPGEQLAGLDFVLNSGGFSVGGTVRDPRNNPVIGAEVIYENEILGIWSGANSDDFGNYQFTNLPAGPAYISVRAWGYELAPARNAVDVTSNLAGIDFNLVDEACVSGQVVDPDGTGIAGVMIAIDYENLDTGFGGYSTDADGNFRVCGLSQGIARLEADPGVGSGFCTTADRVIYVTGRVNNRVGRITIQPCALVEGSVDYTGAPQPCLETEIEADGLEHDADSDIQGDGSYSFHLPDGTHYIYFLEDGESPWDYVAYPAQVIIAGGVVQAGPGVMEIIYAGHPDAASLSGAVNKFNDLDPDPVGRMVVGLLPAGHLDNVTPHSLMNTAEIQEIVLEDFGDYGLQPVPPGTYDVFYALSNPGPEDMESITVLGLEKGVAVDSGGSVAVPPFSYRFSGLDQISGVVFDDVDSGRPVLGALVIVSNANGDLVAFAETDENGAYTIYNPPAGTYTVSVSHPQYQGNPATSITIPNDSIIGPLTLGYQRLSAIPGLEIINNRSGAITWTTNSENPNTGLIAEAKVVDYDGVAADGSSHVVEVEYPDGTHKNLNFQYRNSDGISAVYELYDGNSNVAGNPADYSGNYTFRVTDSGGDWSEAVDGLTVNPVNPPDENTFSPALSPRQTIQATFDQACRYFENGILDGCDTFTGGIDPDVWQGLPRWTWWENNTVRMEHTDSLGRAATWLQLAGPETGGGFSDLETRVRIDYATNDEPFARIGGTYFRVPGGDIFATLGIRGTQAFFTIVKLRWEGSHLISEDIMQDEFLGTVTQGNRYDLRLKYDGQDQFTFTVKGVEPGESALIYTRDYQVTGKSGAPSDPYQGIGIATWHRLATTTPEFDWTPVDGAIYYRVRIYGMNNSTVYRGYTQSPPFRLYPGILKPKAAYKYRIEALKDRQWFEWDNAGRSDRDLTVFVTGAADVEAPAIDLWSLGVYTWTDPEPFGANTWFYVKVHDAQGVPQNIDSVTVTLPDGITTIDLVLDYAESGTTGIYRGVYFGGTPDQNYRFTVIDKDGNQVFADEDLTPQPIAAPEEATLFPPNYHTVGDTRIPFDWADPDYDLNSGAEFYQVNIYDKDFNYLLSFRTESSDFLWPRGLLRENSLYKYRIFARREFHEENVDNGAVVPPFSAGNSLDFITTPLDGTSPPAVDPASDGVVLFMARNPVDNQPVYRLEFLLKVDDPDGVPENIQKVEVTFPDGATKRTLKYNVTKRWNNDTQAYEAVANYYDHLLYTDSLQIQDTRPPYDGVYTFSVYDFNGSPVAAFTDTLPDVTANYLDWAANITPAEGEVVSSTRSAITWVPVADAGYYLVQIMSAWNYPTVSKSEMLSGTGYTVRAGELSPGTTYGLRVYAFRGAIGDEIDFYSGNSSQHVANQRFTIAGEDSDGDGIADGWELQYFGDLSRDEISNSDGDSLNDLQEHQNSTDPLNPDTDGDGVNDGDEVNVHGTNPADSDSDDDWVDDNQEILNGTDPNDPDSFTPPGTGAIRGTLRDAAGTPITGVPLWVNLFSGFPCGGAVWLTGAEADASSGRYIIVGIVPGQYYLNSSNGNLSNYVNEWWAYPASVIDCNDAQAISVTADGWVDDADFQLDLGGEISGSVSDAVTQQPIEFVHINAFNDAADGGAGASTDMDGNYTIRGIPAGCIDVTAFPPSAGDYVISDTNSAYLAPDGVQAGLDFALDPGALRISGTVLSEAGPLAGVRVHVESDVPEIHQHAVTDASGFYQLTNLPPGEAIVNVEAWGTDRAFSAKIIDNLTADLTGFDFNLPVQSCVSGRVVDEIGNGLADVFVYIEPEPNDVELEAVTDFDGHFTVCNLPEGIAYLGLEPNMGSSYCESAERIIYIPAETNNRIDTIALRPCTPVQGNFSYTGPSELCFDFDDAEIWAAGPNFESEAEVQADGSYRILLPDGTHTIYFNWDDDEEPYRFVSYPTQATVINGSVDSGPGTMEVIYSDPNTAVISGSIADSADPDPTGEFLLTLLLPGSLNDVTPEKLAAIDSIQEMYLDGFDGSSPLDFDLTPVPPGRYDVVWMLDNENEGETNIESITVMGLVGGIEVLAGGEILDSAGNPLPAINFEYSAAGSQHVYGYVFDNAGRPVVGSKVVITKNGKLAAYSVTDEAGHWEVYNLPADNYAVAASHPYFESDPDLSTMENVAVTEQPETEIGNLTLNIPATAPGSISGVVTQDPGGQLIPGIWIYAYHFETGDWEGGAQTQSDGSYEIQDLLPGNYRVEADTGGTPYAREFYNDRDSWDDADPVSVAAGLKTSAINLALAAGGSISGRTTRADGSGIADVWVEAFADRCWGNWLGSGYTDSDGNYSIENLPPGDVFVHVWPDYQNFVEAWYDGNSGTNDCSMAAPVTIVPQQTASEIGITLKVGPQRLDWWELVVFDGKLGSGFDLLQGFERFLESATLAGPAGFVYRFDIARDVFDWLTDCDNRFAWYHDFDGQFEYGEYTLTLNYMDGAQETYTRILEEAHPPPVDPNTWSYVVNPDGSIDFSWTPPSSDFYYQVRIYGADGNRYYRADVNPGANSLHVNSNDLRCLEIGQTYRYQIRTYDNVWPFYHAAARGSLIDLVYDPASYQDRVAWIDVIDWKGQLGIGFGTRPGSRNRISTATLTGPKGFSYQFDLQADYYDISIENRLNKGWWKVLAPPFAYGEYTLVVEFNDGITDSRSRTIDPVDVAPVDAAAMSVEVLPNGALRFTWDNPAGVSDQRYNVRIRNLDSSIEYFRSWDVFDDSVIIAEPWDLRFLEHGGTFQWFIRAYDSNVNRMEESARLQFPYDPFGIAPTGSISGIVSDSGGQPIEGLTVKAYYNRCGESFIGEARTVTGGAYTIDEVFSGEIYLETCASCDNLNYIDQAWNNAGGSIHCSEATPATVGDNQQTQDIQGINFTLAAGPQKLQFLRVLNFNGELHAQFAVQPGFRDLLSEAALDIANPNRNDYPTYIYDLGLDRRILDSECRYEDRWEQNFGAFEHIYDYGDYTLRLTFADGSTETYTRTINESDVPAVTGIIVTVNDDGSADLSWNKNTSTGDYSYIVHVMDAADNEYALFDAGISADRAHIPAGRLKCLEIGQTYRWVVAVYDKIHPIYTIGKTIGQTGETTEVSAIYLPAGLERTQTALVGRLRQDLPSALFQVRPGSVDHVLSASVAGPGVSHTFDLTADWIDESTETRLDDKYWMHQDAAWSPVDGDYIFTINYDEDRNGTGDRSETVTDHYENVAAVPVSSASTSSTTLADGAMTFFWTLPSGEIGQKYAVKIRAVNEFKEFYHSPLNANAYNIESVTATARDLRGLKHGQAYQWAVRTFDQWDAANMQEGDWQTFIYNPFGLEMADTDDDGVFDIYDNCIDYANADQADGNGDGEGDACDFDQAPIGPGTYFIDPVNGTDDAVHGTAGADGAWKSLHFAVERINSGSTGSYVLNLTGVTYTLDSEGEDSPLVLIQDTTINGNGAVLDGSGDHGSTESPWTTGLIIAPGATHITISGLTILNFETGVLITSDGGCINLLNTTVAQSETGLKIVDTYQATIDLSGTSVTNNRVGLHLTAGSSGNILRGGGIDFNQTDGIRLESDGEAPEDNRVEDMDVTGNGENGIVIYDGGGNVIADSRIHDNNTSRTGYGGIAVYTGRNEIVRNEIDRNNCYGVWADDALSTQPLAAVNNIWDSGSGPQHPVMIPAGTGDAVSDHVEFMPWVGFDPASDDDNDGWPARAEAQAGTDPDDGGDFPDITRFTAGGLGADDNNLGDAIRPLKTLHGAVNRIDGLGADSFTIDMLPGAYCTGDSCGETLEANQPLILAQNVTINGAGAVLNGAGADNWTAGLVVTAGAQQVEINGLVIEGFQYGLLINSDGGCIILSNALITANESGLKIVDTYQTTVDLSNSIISDNLTGVDLHGASSGNRILNGTVQNHTADGIRVEGGADSPDDNLFSKINVVNNAGNGLVFYDGKGNEISDCRITGNNTEEKAYGGIAVFTGATVTRNVIENNRCHGVWVDDALSTQPLNATYNWWGSIDGPSGQGPGTGDGVSINVVYEPWAWMLPTEDTDFDGLIDSWEIANFGDLSETGSGDPDYDGWSNRAEDQEGTDPTVGTSHPAITTFYVGGTGADDNNLGNDIYRLQTLHGAIARINGLAPGDYTVHLDPGLYCTGSSCEGVREPDEPLIVNQNVAVIGPGAIVDGTGAGRWTTGLLFTAGAADTRIEGLTIQNFVRGLLYNIDGGCAVLEAVMISDSESGLKLVDTYQLTIDLTTSQITQNQTGIELAAGSSGNTFQNGTVQANIADGILIDSDGASPDDNLFESMQVLDNGRNGVILLGGVGNRVDGCTITGNNTSRTGYGGVAVFTGGTSVNHNTIEGNLCAGVYADDALSTENLNAENNWWGNADGPGGSGPGTGDGVNEFQDTLPLGRKTDTFRLIWG